MPSIELFQIQGAPFGNCLSISDGPADNSTGLPFFYVTPKDNTVADLMKNSVASLTLPEVEGDFCRYHEYDSISFLYYIFNILSVTSRNFADDLYNTSMCYCHFLWKIYVSFCCVDSTLTQHSILNRAYCCCWKRRFPALLLSNM